ncbi:MAG: DUF366 family protein [Ammonifex sp.]|nr:MAG: DUF366 family protein [Ammonifex sp.]
MVKTFLCRESLTYDGSQLSPLWAFKRLGVQGDSIVAFRGACRVEAESLVDIADFKSGAIIFSTDMLNFIAEHFENDLEKAVLRQRLLVALTREVLEAGHLKARLSREGDDLFAGTGKLSVSIATITPVSTMIHLGLNVTAQGAPVEAIGLLDLGLPEEAVFELARQVLDAYAEEMEGVGLARCKVRGVW